MHATYQHLVPGLLYLAELCLSLPVSNTWPERGASAVKRIKTQMRSKLKNDMLGALLHITLNGPAVKESDQLIQATIKEWIRIGRSFPQLAGGGGGWRVTGGGQWVAGNG